MFFFNAAVVFGAAAAPVFFRIASPFLIPTHFCYKLVSAAPYLLTRPIPKTQIKHNPNFSVKIFYQSIIVPLSLHDYFPSAEYFSLTTFSFVLAALIVNYRFVTHQKIFLRIFFPQLTIPSYPVILL